MGIIQRAIAKDASVVISVADATDVVATMEQIHHTSAVMSAALGRLTIAAGLMSYGLNEDDSITLRVDGGGPGGALTAVANHNGDVKAYAANPLVELPLNDKGKLDVGGAVGTDGNLTVAKDLGLANPYVGVVPLVSGEIAEDLARYFVESEQTPTACGLGVLVNPNLTIQYAGGYLIQLLPDAPDTVIDQLENNIQNAPPMTTMMQQGMTAEQIALQLLEGLEPNLLDKSELNYRCDCSRERTTRLLASLGADELRDLARTQEETTVSCHFCDKVYTFSAEELEELATECEA